MATPAGSLKVERVQLLYSSLDAKLMIVIMCRCNITSVLSRPNVLADEMGHTFNERNFYIQDKVLYVGQ